MSAYAQLHQDLPGPPDHPNHALPHREVSTLRIYWLAAVVCCGGLLFGYDSGVIGGVLIFDSFRRDFQYSPTDQTRVSAIAVGIQQAGALAGCLLIWPLTNRWGRRRAMMLCSTVFCVGVVFEVINSHSLLLFYLGRIICGLGVGAAATVIPIYLTEMSPKHLRARLGSGFQFTFTIGILASYWIDYGLQFRTPTAAQWQIPLALQLVPGALMGLGMFTLDESVRWLLAHGDTPAAWASLAWIRAVPVESISDPTSAVAVEFAEMKHAVDEDRQAMAGFHPRELLRGPNARRIALAVTIFLAQQSTGATALAYFGPQFFALLVGDNNNSDNKSLTLLLTGIFGALKVISCLIFIVFVAERFGRKPLLIVGALAMSICMLATSAVVKSTDSPPPSSSTSGITVSGITTVALIYLDIIFYNFSWGPLPWPCAAELFSTRIREPGVAAAVASQWLFNFIWSFSTPYILAGLGWATFLIFAAFDIVFAGFVAVCLPETAGKTLEEIDLLFEPAKGDFTVLADGDEEGEDEPDLDVHDGARLNNKTRSREGFLRVGEV